MGQNQLGNFINQMEKNDSKKGPLISYFSLHRLKPHCHYPPVAVDFSNHLPLSCSTPVLPVFNHDLCHFTPSFLLSSEKSCSMRCSEQQKFADRMRTQEQLVECCGSQQSTLWQRASDARYCQVCKLKFEDYWTHIDGPIHKHKIAKNIFNKDIQHLCQIYDSRQQSSLLTAKTGSSSSKQGQKRNRGQQRCQTESAPNIKDKVATVRLPPQTQFR